MIFDTIESLDVVPASKCRWMRGTLVLDHTNDTVGGDAGRLLLKLDKDSRTGSSG